MWIKDINALNWQIGIVCSTVVRFNIMLRSIDTIAYSVAVKYIKVNMMVDLIKIMFGMNEFFTELIAKTA